MAHKADAPARVLSGGEQQRVALARAWALQPGVLFLDEPTASLDPGAAADVERLIAEIAAEGTHIVMSTHNLGQARRLGDEVAFMHQGRITELTPVSEFFDQPRSAEARHFLKGELPWT
jgi:tungstate transport system ATP-binding protein